MATGGFTLGALAQANAGGQINDGNYPPGFDCGTLGSPKAQLECRALQTSRSPDNTVPPGTPAFPMPGEPNGTTYSVPNLTPESPNAGRRPAHNG